MPEVEEPAMLDALNQEIKVGDYVFFYANFYVVKKLGRARYGNHGPVSIMLVEASKTTRPVTKHSKEMILVEEEKIIKWKLTRT